MKRTKLLTALGFGVLVSGCASVPATPTSAPTTSPTASFVAGPVQATGLPASISVSEINVDVPYSLKVSEGNGYYPFTDIVWRGDPIGDRRAQIREIFKTALTLGTRSMQGETPLILDVELKRFHSITDRTRLSVGGVHHMVFEMTVRDARTGATILPAREIDTSLKAYGGIRAVKADQRGQTQKVRVTGYLARLIQQELGQPITR